MQDNITATIHFSIDRAGFETGPKSGTSNFFSGWAAHPDNSRRITAIRFMVRDVNLATLPIKHERPDLLLHFDTAMLGFWGPVYLDEKYLGMLLRIEAIDSAGEIHPMTDYLLTDTVSPEEQIFSRQLNLPDDTLRHLVVTNIDPFLFVQRGKEGVELILSVMKSNEITIELFNNILDFGVGCGRVMRWWDGRLPGVTFWGTDINEQLIRWCSDNIPFAKFSVNTLHPPLQYRDSTFDFLYAFSIFTHLTIETQKEWLNEFSRILVPSGYALVSVHGDKDAESLDAESKSRYEHDGVLVLSSNAEGENMCATYQNASFSNALFSESFDIVDFLPAGRSSTSSQDLYLLRKKA